MAREIYNKNAREKALLEEAYNQVYKQVDEDFASTPLGKKHLKGVQKKYDDEMDAHERDVGRAAYERWTDKGEGDVRPKPEYPEALRRSSDEEGNTLEAILPTLEFKETTKQAKQYQYAQSSQNMPAMSYTVVQQQQPVVTVTSDGKETENVAEPNDIIMSGPSREQYVVKPEKFIGERGLYTGKMGGTVTPEQSPRIVARVENITQPVTFKAPWGEDMILKRGDYLVKDGDQGYYRIAQKEYDETYNAI
tara:strand:- start:75 stop:824 length:750 start_codon:yes stop_codon:yes gene_type:complete